MSCSGGCSDCNALTVQRCRIASQPNRPPIIALRRLPVSARRAASSSGGPQRGLRECCAESAAFRCADRWRCRSSACPARCLWRSRRTRLSSSRSARISAAVPFRSSSASEHASTCAALAVAVASPKVGRLCPYGSAHERSPSARTQCIPSRSAFKESHQRSECDCSSRRRPLPSRARVIDPCTQLLVGARVCADKYAGTRATLLARCVLCWFAFATAERAVTPDGMEPGQCRALTATHGLAGRRVALAGSGLSAQVWRWDRHERSPTGPAHRRDLHGE